MRLAVIVAVVAGSHMCEQPLDEHGVRSSQHQRQSPQQSGILAKSRWNNARIRLCREGATMPHRVANRVQYEVASLPERTPDHYYLGIEDVTEVGERQAEVIAGVGERASAHRITIGSQP